MNSKIGSWRPEKSWQLAVSPWLLLFVLLGAIVVRYPFAEMAAAGKGPDPVAGAQGLPPSDSRLGFTVPATVVGVVDGDTIEVEFTFRSRIRLPSCWAPELRASRPETKKAALRAKLDLASRAIGKRAVVHVSLSEARRLGDLFSFDRLVADVTLAGAATSLSQQQVAAGHASSTKGGPLGR